MLNKRISDRPILELRRGVNAAMLHRGFYARVSSGGGIGTHSLIELKFSTDVVPSFEPPVTPLHLEFLLPKVDLPNPQPMPGHDTKSIDTLERESLEFARESGMYPGKYFKALEATNVAGLVAVTYGAIHNFLISHVPSDQRESFVDVMDGVYENLAPWISKLFDLDDWVDFGTTTVNPEKIRAAKERLLEIFTEILTKDDPDLKEVVQDSDTPVTKAMATTFLKLSGLTKCFGDVGKMFLECFVGSFEEYLQSVEVERRAEMLGNQVCNLDAYKFIRDDCSRARHAVRGVAACFGIDSVSLEKSYYELKIMLQSTARCVEFSNDVLSWVKESSALIKAQRRQSHMSELEPWNDHELRGISGSLAVNIVQVHWKNLMKSDSETSPTILLKRAFELGVREHNESVKTFQTFYLQLKSVMESELQRSGLSETKRTQLEKRHHSVNAYTELMIGWLSQPWWAVLVPRYSLGAPVPTHSEYHDLARQLGDLIIGSPGLLNARM